RHRPGQRIGPPDRAGEERGPVDRRTQGGDAALTLRQRWIYLPCMRASLSFRNSLVSLAVFLFFPFAGPAAAVDGVWRSLGPDGGPVYSLAFQPGSSRVIYAGGGGA